MDGCHPESESGESNGRFESGAPLGECVIDVPDRRGEGLSSFRVTEVK